MHDTGKLRGLFLSNIEVTRINFPFGRLRELKFCFGISGICLRLTVKSWEKMLLEILNDGIAKL